MKKTIWIFSLVVLLFSTFAPSFTYATGEVKDEAIEILSNTLEDTMALFDDSHWVANLQQSEDSFNLLSNEYVVTYDLNWWYWTEDWSTESKQITYTTNDIWSTDWKTPSKWNTCSEWNNNSMKCMFEWWYYTWLETRFTWYVTENVTVYAKWLPFSDKTINLWNTSLIIMDRNIWATSNNVNNSSSYWLQFQRGNNYWFKAWSNNSKGFPNNELDVDYAASDWNDHISTYYNSKWRKMNPWNNWSSKNDNLWWWFSYESWDDERQWPCPWWYHVPTADEREKLWELLNLSYYTQIRDTLNLPLAWYRRYEDTTIYSLGSQWYYWSSTPSTANYAYSMRFASYSINWKYGDGQYHSYGYPIRCFKNVDYKPIRYNLNWWINAENNPISTNYWMGILDLKSPERENSIFSWWYTWTNFDELTPVTTNEISSDEDIINLYAKWSCFNWFENLWDRCQKIDNWKSALLLDWKSFNKKIKSIAKKQNVTSESSWDYSIQKIKRAPESPEWITWIISATGSEYPVYAWFNDDEKALYYYSEATTIYFNEDSSYMFYYLTKLKSLDLWNFDTSIVTDMSYMFSNCSKLTELNISNFNTSKVTNMQSMFSYCNQLKQLDLSNFDTRNVTNMMAMFMDDNSLETLNVSSFNTENVKRMSYMFSHLNSLKELNVSNFNTSKVTSFDDMFRDDRTLTSLDLSNFDTSNVIYMWQMFYGCSNLRNINLNGWNTSKVRDMYYMFNWCSSLENLDLSSFNTKSVTSMHYMFYGCTNLKNLDISNFDTRNVSSMNYMFRDCRNLESLDLSSFNTSKVSDMSYMFYNCNRLKTIYVWMKFRIWNLTSSYSSASMFENAISLEWWNWTKYNSENPKDKTYARIDSEWKPWYFTLKWVFQTSAYLLPWETINVKLKTIAQTWNSSIYYYTSDEHITKILRYTWDVIPENIPHDKIVEISAPDSDWKVYARYDDWIIYYYSNVKAIELNSNSSYMFENMRALKEIDLKDFDTSDVTSMSYMFNWCSSLENLDLSSFDTRNVSNMYYMFYWCTNLKKLDIENFDTSNLVYAFNMFTNCQSLTELNLSNFDTRNVTDMWQMFMWCNSLEKLDLSNFDTRNVTDMSSMFAYCNNLKEIDLSSFDTVNVTRMERMFNSSPKLKTIYVWEKFKINSNVTSWYMFTWDISLVWWNWTTYNENYTNWIYAVIDDDNHPWYFTNILDRPYNITYNLNWWEIVWERYAYTQRDSFTLPIPIREGYSFMWWRWSNWENPEQLVEILMWTKGDLFYEAIWLAPASWGWRTITPTKQETKVTEQEHNSADLEKIEVEEVKSTQTTTSPTIKEQVKKVEWKSLTRWEIAVMTNILLDVYPQLTENRTLNEVSEACENFADEQNFTKDEKKAITRLCKLSIMWIHRDNNEPLDEFMVRQYTTNWEFATVMDRVVANYTEKDLSLVKDALKKLENDEENVVFWTVYDVFMSIKNIFN